MTTGESPDTAVRRDRFSGGPARGFLSSLAADEAIFAADLDVDRAHVVMLAEQGIIADEVAGDILSALDEIETAGHDALPPGEDVHEAIETAVIDRVGPEGGKMHTARSRNDEVATCLRYRVRADLLDVAEATIALREALRETAAAHTETVMPGYTHLQPAQPTTVAHYLLSYEAAIARDTARLLDAYERVNQSPLGGAAFAGTPFDIDRERTAELLGFDGIVRNSMDAASARDFLVEAASALATLSVTLSGLAEDVVLFANRGFLELADEYASTSSIMPQKKNPDTLELTRGVAGDAVGAATGVLTTVKGLPRAYNRDLQRAHPGVFEAAEAVRDATDVAGGAIVTVTWNEDVLADAAAEGFSTATGIADLLAMAGIPFRTAHEVVATAATAATEATVTTEVTSTTASGAADETHGEAQTAETGGVTPATLDAAAEEVLGESLFDHVSRADVEAALDPVHSVASRDSVGGPAPDAVADELVTAEAGIEDDAETLTARRDHLSAAADLRDAEVASYE